MAIAVLLLLMPLMAYHLNGGGGGGDKHPRSLVFQCMEAEEEVEEYCASLRELSSSSSKGGSGCPWPGKEHSEAVIEFLRLIRRSSSVRFLAISFNALEESFHNDLLKYSSTTKR